MSTRTRAIYALTVLFAINTLNFFDRQILGAVTEPIRKEWNLSDMQIGVLGTVFTLLYAVVGLPLATGLLCPKEGLLSQRTFKLKKIFSQEEFNRFAALSGDDNPIHVDPEFAAGTRFGRTVAHGMLLYAVIETLLGDTFPGVTQLEQELMFTSPVYANEEIEFRLEVAEVGMEQRQARLDVLITKPDGTVACQGAMKVSLPESI